MKLTMKCARLPFGLPVLFLAGMLLGCGIDRSQFDQLYSSGKQLEVEVKRSGAASPLCDDLMRKFQTELAIAEGRVQQPKEQAIARAYREAADAYQFLLRVRFLDFEAIDGLILLMGTNLDAANRYGLKIVKRGNSDWTDTAEALRVMFDVAEQKLRAADQLLRES